MPKGVDCGGKGRCPACFMVPTFHNPDYQSCKHQTTACGPELYMQKEGYALPSPPSITIQSAAEAIRYQKKITTNVDKNVL